VTSIANAEAIVLASNADVSIDISAPTVPTAVVEGIVVDETGHPLGGAEISLRPLARSAAIDDVVTTVTSGTGHFALSSVRRGVHALQAVHRSDGDRQIARVGVVEVAVADRPIDPIPMTLVPAARLEGRILYDGDDAEFARVATVRVVAEGPDAEARDVFTAGALVDADGSFAVSNVLGRNRLVIRILRHSWFAERAVLDDGTDIANTAFNFEPGRTYTNVRVFATNRVALVVAKLPAVEETAARVVVVFPADASLWGDSRYVQVEEARRDENEIGIGVPPGRDYLVAMYLRTELNELPPPDRISSDMLLSLASNATAIFVDQPTLFRVTLQLPQR